MFVTTTYDITKFSSEKNCIKFFKCNKYFTIYMAQTGHHTGEVKSTPPPTQRVSLGTNI